MANSNMEAPRTCPEQFPALLRRLMRKHVASNCLDSGTQRSTQMCLQGSASADEAFRPWDTNTRGSIPSCQHGPVPGCTVGQRSRPSRPALGITSHFRSFQFLTDLSLHPSHLPQPCHSPVSSPLLHCSWTPVHDPELQSLLQEAPLLTWMNEKAQKPPGYCNRDTLSSLSHFHPGYWHPKETQREGKPLTVSPLPTTSVSSKTALPSLWVKTL